MLKKHEVVLLILALSLTGLLVYSPHLDYKYPLHVDEWHHIAKIVHIIDTGKFEQVNPYLNTYQPDLEPGFNILWAGFFYVTKLDPVLNYYPLAAAFAIFSALALFLLVYYLSKNFYTALFSILFFASLKSDVNISGLWFFTPMTMAIPLIFLFLLFFLKSFESNKYFVLTLVMFSLLSTIHPISGILVYSIACVYLFIHFNLLKNNLKKSFIFVLFPLFTFLIFYLFFWKSSSSELFRVLKDWIILEKGWGYTELSYSLPVLYGLLSTFFAIIGFFAAIKVQKTRIFIIWAALVAALLALFYLKDYSILISYQRAVYFCLLALVPLSAFGLSSTMSFLKRKSKKAFVFITIILCIIVFSYAFEDYGELSKNVALYHVIEEEDYDSIKFLEQYKGSLVMSPLKFSTAIYPISKNRVIAFTKGNLWSPDFTDVQLFYEIRCDEKIGMIKYYKISIVLSREKIGCEGLEEIYHKQNYIYQIKNI